MTSGEGNKSSIGEVEFWTIGGGTVGEAITVGGGNDLPPLDALFIEPFFDSQDIASIVTVGGKCFEVDPVNPDAIFDLSDLGWDLAGCEAIDAHDFELLFREASEAKARKWHDNSQ